MLRGFLARVAWTVDNREEARALGRQAREYVLRERTIEKTIGQWLRAGPGGQRLAAL